MSIRIKTKFTHNLDSVTRRINIIMRRVPVIMGNEGKRFINDSFRAQGYIEGPGVVRPWQSRSPGAERNSRSLLIDSGHLRRSIVYVARSPRQVDIVSDLSYAEIHNLGGTITQTVTPKQRQFFFAKFKATGNARWKKMALSKTITIKIPQRQFIGDSPELRSRIQTKLQNEIIKVLQ